jgi:hypothetical protein
MAISIEIMVAIVAVARLNLMAKRISGESRAEMKAFQLVYESKDTTIPTKKIASKTRAPIVAVLNTLSPATPLRTLNIYSYPQTDFYLTSGL